MGYHGNTWLQQWLQGGASDVVGDDEPNVMAWTPDDVMEHGVEEFKRLWPEKWEVWLAWCAEGGDS
jgi:hypothetical protein